MKKKLQRVLRIFLLFSVLLNSSGSESVSNETSVVHLELEKLIQVRDFSGELDNANSSKHSDESLDIIEKVTDLPGFMNVFRFATVCDTPNHDPGFCIELSKCSILAKEIHNNKTANFLLASRCGPHNENQHDPKVCCGRYNNFKNVSKIMADDVKILPKKCGKQKTILRSRIVGGQEASIGEYPWMVRLIHQNSYGYKTYGCSAFLIHSKYVLTAGHCVESNFTLIRGPLHSVAIGEHNIETKIDCSPGGSFCAPPTQFARVDTIMVHPKYNRNSKDHHNDIALIHLRKGARLSEYVQPICLPEETLQNVTSYYVSGWGKTETREYSPVKLKVGIKPFDKDDCVNKFETLNLEIDDSQICAGGEKNKDSCAGDSGGPLIAYNEETKTYYAAGLVSYGIGCGLKGWPGVYTNIPTYMEWVKNNILATSLRTRSPSGKKKNRRKKSHVKNTTTLRPT